jgi:dihydrofolate reductase
MRLTLIAAQSLDGFITQHDTPGSAFASEADRAFFRKALQGFDCCVMGAKTYRTARDQIRRTLMPERLRIVITHTPDTFRADATVGTLEFHNRSPKELITLLRGRGYSRCAILGGAQIHSLFLEAGFVDELWITVEPLLFGRGTPLLAQAAQVSLKLLAHENLSEDTLLLKYQVKR